jgi:ribosome-binding protein aMBF1 (putative translation factor)
MEHAEKPQEKALEVTALPTGAAAGGAVVRDTGKVEVAPKAKPVSEVNTSKEKAAGAGKRKSNRVRKARIDQMMSKAELARRANLSVLTIDRVEKGFGCRMDTKRKILEALGLSLADRVRVFGEEE